MLTLSWLIIALPLASAATILLSGRAARRWGHALGVAASFATVVVGVGAFIEMLGREADDRAFHETLFAWVTRPANRARRGRSPPSRPWPSTGS